ncbi:hypothetical protein ACJX0J_036585, partial [Zea mays]
CLPSDLEGAIRQSGKASADFVNSGGMRAIAELLIPQLEFLNEEGAQAELWALSKIFLDTLVQETGQKVTAIFPDAGAAALLKHQWKDAQFKCASLGDRKPVGPEDEVAVMIIPDHQMLEAVERITSQLSDDPIRPLVMWNPRLVSGDVGVGFNVRNLRRNFLSTFTTVYSMRPLPTGAVFRCFPGQWKVPNRYLLARELTSRPDATDIEVSHENMTTSSFKNELAGDKYLRTEVYVPLKIILVHPCCFQSILILEKAGQSEHFSTLQVKCTVAHMFLNSSCVLQNFKNIIGKWKNTLYFLLRVKFQIRIDRPKVRVKFQIRIDLRTRGSIAALFGPRFSAQ